MSVRAIIVSARVRALLSLGMVLGLGAVGTLAAWSTATTTNSGVFTTGTVDLQLNGNNGPVSVGFNSPLTVLPGKSLAAILLVQNKSNLDFKYTIDAAGGAGTLTSSLRMTVIAGNDTAVSNNACSTSSNTTVVANSIALGASTRIASRGSLAANTGVEKLCIQFTLPTGVDNAVQGTVGNAQLVFTASST
jgi:predicted ribosomally synthesized peptide with SipW-like signal peptide